MAKQVAYLFSAAPADRQKHQLWGVDAGGTFELGFREGAGNQDGKGNSVLGRGQAEEQGKDCERSRDPGTCKQLGVGSMREREEGREERGRRGERKGKGTWRRREECAWESLTGARVLLRNESGL